MNNAVEVKPLSEAKSTEFRGIPAALERAAKAAYDLAKQTNTCLIVEKNGQIVRLKPD
jgi:hypothetical protein